MSYSQEDQGPVYSSIAPDHSHSDLLDDHFSTFVEQANPNLRGYVPTFIPSDEEKISELTKLWIDERGSPELLPYQQSLVEPLIDAIESQTDMIGRVIESGVDIDNFKMMIYQTEIERVKYLLKSYLRTRLHKIEKMSLYLLRKPNFQTIMSSQEIIYARGYRELIEKFNHHSFLYELPRSQHKQDEMNSEVNMVILPNFEAPVFCKVLTAIDPHEFATSNAPDAPFEQDDIYMIRYCDIRQQLRDGRIRLL
ncbi:hypothetical protein BDB01DRAFT_541151 [Pilobolus umbonatus]|nr:hypothetical protein BDB01DRAFT_541151 [Pilobolus umbonatus]